MKSIWASLYFRRSGVVKKTYPPWDSQFPPGVESHPESSGIGQSPVGYRRLRSGKLSVETNQLVNNKELNYEQNVIRPADGRTAAIELELEPFIEDGDTRVGRCSQ
jgi:hypothetical protein